MSPAHKKAIHTKPELTIILPMHNEEKHVKGCLVQVSEAAAKITPHYEIMVAEDGSSDHTLAFAQEFARKNRHVKVFHSDKRIGRGAALSRSLRAAHGKISVYMDSDLSSNLNHLNELVSRINKGAVIATGSRLLPSSSTTRSAKRDVASRGFNFLVRALLGSRLHDHQCGFKAFNTRKVQPLLSEVEDNHWFWDTEMLVRGQRRGLRIDEIPIQWAEKGKTSTVDLRKDVAYMASKIIYLKSKLG